MSMSSLVIREFRASDVDSIRELSAKLFSDARPKEYFVWNFVDNPVSKGVGMVAEDSGRIVAHVAMLPRGLCIGNEVLLGAQGVDSMTDPDHQGLFVPLFSACMKLAASTGIEVGYGCPNPKSYPALVYMLNWDHTGEIPRWIRLLGARSALLMNRSPSRLLASMGMNLLPMGDDNPSGIEVRRDRPTDDELVSLADDINRNMPARSCRIARPKEWFSWRFNNESQRRYQWFSAYRGRDLKAWAVFGLNDWGEKPLITMAGTEPETLEAAVSAATRQAKNLGITELMSVTNNEDSVRALKACGYFQRKSMPLIVKPFTNRTLNANIHLHSSWRIACEDLDSF